MDPGEQDVAPPTEGARPARRAHVARRLRQAGADAPGWRIGMRWWLGAAFAAVGVVTAASVYFFVSDSSQRVLKDRASELAAGRTVNLADRLGRAQRPGPVIAGSIERGFQAWYFDRDGRLVSPNPPGPLLDEIKGRGKFVDSALVGLRTAVNLPDDLIVVTSPVFGGRDIKGAVVGRYSQPDVLRGAINRLRHDSLRALAIAVAIGILAGSIVATLISFRIKRLARSAEQMATGELDMPLGVGGRDEVGDLARSLETMRAALRESFEILSSERDRLSSVFAGLTDAVMVVGADGAVRFSNPAAESLLAPDGGPVEALVPQVRLAIARGRSGTGALRIDERVYAVQARSLAAEQAVLLVVRDRTEEMRREIAERDFVSNAAHELRNPLAGISGTIEVLQSGAKDDPVARERFLSRLSADAERMTRLTQALLTLARVEALGPAEAEIVDVRAAVDDVVKATFAPVGVELRIEVEPELAAKADPVLLRQVLIGLLSNACKHTPAPGVVSLRARHEATDQILLEVIDTGTGIPPDEVERVFERFYRAAGSLSREGFGLGLAIAKRMVDVMGGEIGVSSVEGEGSTFWVLLPVASPTIAPLA